MTALYGAAATGITLPEALEAARLDGGCALLTAPSAYRLARAAGRGCVTPTGPADLSAVYEARVFTAHVELRWVEAGYAVLLTEDASLLPGAFGEPLDALDVVTTIETRYLVWGTATTSTPGWAMLASARVGALAVPMAAAPETGRIRLAVREYVVADKAHGNAYVAEERLIGFEPYPLEGAAR
ncbi:CRISPR-associated protein Csx19 [Sphaerisporangium sp. NPDC051017]|uniref:type III-D CRISPR-associated protein Csx19 n=1 Tax=Sphaerisporangium sp. NPDC051017 TaxID=3154636 RepID=UPI00341A5BBD